jgi:hypothetical protein
VETGGGDMEISLGTAEVIGCPGVPETERLELRRDVGKMLAVKIIEVGRIVRAKFGDTSGEIELGRVTSSSGCKIPIVVPLPGYPLPKAEGDKSPVSLEGGASIVVAGLRDRKKGLVTQNPLKCCELGSLLRDDQADVMGHRDRGKTTFECLTEASRVEGGSNPGRSKGDESLVMAWDGNWFRGNQIAKGLTDLGGDDAIDLTRHTAATRVRPKVSPGLGRNASSARPIAIGGPRKARDPMGGPAGGVGLVRAGNLASGKGGADLGDRDGGPVMPIKNSAKNVLGLWGGAGGSRVRGFSNPNP